METSQVLYLSQSDYFCWKILFLLYFCSGQLFACFFFLTYVQTHLAPIHLIEFSQQVQWVWKYSISNTLSPCPTPEKEIVVVKGLEQELNLASLRVGINTECINLQLWLRQAFSLLFSPPLSSFSWLLVLVWLFLHRGYEYGYRICWTGELFWI